MKTASCLPVVFSVAFASILCAQTAPLRIEQTVEARFPAALAFSSLSEGEARVVINVDADGKLIDWLVTGYTNKAFADEAVAVLKQWHYVPAIEKGQPVGVRLELCFAFEARGRVVSLLAIETPEVLFRQAGAGQRYITRVCHLQELDRPIAPLNPASPVNPLQAGAPAEARSVLVDFYIDEHGQPRMPVVVNSPQTILAQAAVDALNRWRFNAPTRGGKPMTVRVRQEFIFPGSS